MADLKMTEMSYFSPMGYQRNTCGYCKKAEGSASYYASSTSVRAEEYETLMDRGWRRSGSLYYKPNLARSCCPHYTIRLDPGEYRPRRDQRKALNRWTAFVLGPEYTHAAARLCPRSRQEKKRHDQTFDLSQRVHEMEYPSLPRPVNPLTKRTIEPAHKFEVNIEADSFSVAKFELFLRYQTTIHKEHESRWKRSDFERFLCAGIKRKTVKHAVKQEDGSTATIEQKVGSYHQCYRLDGKLVAVAVLDLLPRSVSSVYIFYDPEYEKFEFGKLSAMREIALTQEMHLQHYYMGYYIHSCPKMRYKGTFRPQYIQDPETYEWHSLDEVFAPKLETQRYFSTSGQQIPDDYEDIPDEDALSLFDLHMPGVLTVEQLKSTIDLDHWHLLIRNMLVEMIDLVGWEDSSVTNPQSIKGIVAELAASLGPEVVKNSAVVMFQS
ncbi:arginyl-tRNA-protein transferase 1 [Nannizzia gypsea CBS 118893]|uniref:arginyltransferase n=1 Tax=Arthroderma gypseum (strain ATCC MYA-4604 / CBS 118893) TaxID=535722 RepID=E4UQN0_ARTGP|nr:arginyl-tRNA-protein transferase 1 [Nannizzia gypsea CBS 118893]EFQ99259.1 arginyl-tRNA-protein transferase 1 [Nannizzia gypsea CBS 118893]